MPMNIPEGRLSAPGGRKCKTPIFPGTGRRCLERAVPRPAAPAAPADGPAGDPQGMVKALSGRIL